MWTWIIRIVFFITILFNLYELGSLVIHLKKYLSRFSDDKLDSLSDKITSDIMSELRSSGFFDSSNSNMHKEN